MDTSIAKILSRVYELEGLLLVAQKHGTETPSMVIDNILDHTREVDDMAHLLRDMGYGNQPEAMPPVPPVAAPTVAEPPVVKPPVFQPQPVPEDELPGNETDDEEPPRRDQDDEPKEVFQADYQEPERVGEKPNIQFAEDDIVEERSISDPVDDNVDFNPDDEVTLQMPMRVDEKLQRTLSQDLRKAFSVNDRFRFRRELFANSDADFNDALNLIETMKSYDEAREYFLDDLGWDEEVPEVADFLNIISKHFH